ncbi:SUN domain-containing protein [Seminavis robusta]|uniref:SUN domain-containing protein n=1 Tax=Seminavis robusta TaxID=568900 RepID=A0A9N8DD56_9STRA|nr:SUN domain-containing protein [Seminavis robusta]|eukprot:Sro69_g038390.1 SUN domain-containing protein (1382) ;mRNA; r:7493-11638
MRLRGRRVVLLIAGALPLLAEDDIAVGVHAEAALQHVSQLPEEEPDGNIQATESLHEETLSLLPLNLLQVEAEFSGEPTYVQGKGRIVESATADVDQVPVVIEAVGETTAKEPPDDEDNNDKIDEEEEEEATIEQEANEKGEDTGSATATNNTDDNHQTASDTDDKEQEEEEDKQEDNQESDAADELDSPQDDSGEAEEAAGITGEEADQSSDNATKDSDDFAEAERVPTEPENNNNNSSNNTVSEETTATENANDTAPIDAHKDTTTHSTTKKEKTEPELNKILQVDYASKSAGALVLEKSSNFKGTSNLLNGDRDRYAIAPCSENPKFVVVSLSEDILVKQVKLANYELYSSRVKDFEIQISQTMGNWVDLGSYTASPASGIQTFDLEEPAWGRYLKFTFNSHYGDEFYCTLSQLMVHGSTMVQGFHEHLQETNEEEDIIMNELEMDVGSTEDDEPKDSPTAIKDADSVVEGTGEKSAAATSSSASENQPTHGPAVGDVDSGSDSPQDTSTTAEARVDADASETHEIDVAAGEKESSDAAAVEHTTKVGEEEISTDETTDADGAGETSEEPGNEMYTGTVLPAASIGLSSSNVFSTIVGSLEPLHLKGVHRLSELGSPAFPDSEKLHNILAKATDSTIAIKNALTDPAILENLQAWGVERTNHLGRESVPPEAFGSSAIGPREQTLAEKLTEYIQDIDNSQTMRPFQKDSVNDASPGALAGAQNDGIEIEENDNDSEDDEDETEEVLHQNATVVAQSDAPPKSNGLGLDSYASLHDKDLALATLLEKLPSIECLKKLDFHAFKEKAMASRRGAHGGSGSAAAGHAMEPIFKMLTDQIKTLQSNLSVHDQFTKEAVQCYQKVLLDVVVEMQSLRMNHEARLAKLEQDLQETKTVRWVFVLYQLIMGLPNWASLFAATFFTSFVSPAAIARPLEIVEVFLQRHISNEVHSVLSWTITACIMLLSIVSTVSLCQRIVTALRSYKAKFSPTIPARKEPSEEVSCRLSVENENGEMISVCSAHSEAEEAGEDLQRDEAEISDAEDVTREVQGGAATFQDSLSKLPASPSSVANLTECNAKKTLPNDQLDPEQPERHDISMAESWVGSDQNQSLPPVKNQEEIADGQGEEGGLEDSATADGGTEARASNGGETPDTTQRKSAESQRGDSDNNEAAKEGCAAPSNCNGGHESLAERPLQEAEVAEDDQAAACSHETTPEDLKGSAVHESCDTTVAEETSSKGESCCDTVSVYKSGGDDILETPSEGQQGAETNGRMSDTGHQSEVVEVITTQQELVTEADIASRGAPPLDAEVEANQETEVATKHKDANGESEPNDCGRGKEPEDDVASATKDCGHTGSQEELSRSTSSNAIEESIPLVPVSAVDC